MAPPISRDIDGRRIPSRGHCYLYVFPCAWEDHCKLGFSRDPLSRMQALHRRWFEFFDLDRGLLVETETVRDARDLELELGRPLGEHNAPAPMTVRREAAGHTEWYRGASAQLEQAGAALERRGHVVHAPLRGWLQLELRRRSDQLYAWTQALLPPDALDGPAGPTPSRKLVRDALDACDALAIDLEPLLPAHVYQWHRGAT